MPQSILRLGTRGSRLALAQAGTVCDALAARGVACELIVLRTTGDRIQDRPLAALGGKGLFTKELEDALLDGRIDLAVHSMKDVPVALPQGLCIAAILTREDPRDAFLSRQARSLSELAAGARIGTSSVRRQAQVARARPDLAIMPLRGNVDTRLAKLDAGELDAIILACAGLKRLGMDRRITAALSLDDWLPALSQGAIGVESRIEDVHLFSSLNDEATAAALACERGFQQALDGSCLTSIGGIAKLRNGELSFRGEVLAPDGSGSAETAFTSQLGADPVAEAGELGQSAGTELRPRVLQWLAA
ncbi:MAG: hydroxymethylbilane synthase [Alphaproteobacteria bacterium]|jgi:hydroxymethylbilane synthase